MIENQLRRPWGVLHSFCTKNTFYDEMDLRLLFSWRMIQTAAQEAVLEFLANALENILAETFLSKIARSRDATPRKLNP